jgi:hypothetical protein
MNINYSMIAIGVAATLLFQCPSIQASELGYCSSVLQEKAFNTQNISTKYNVMQSLRDNLCRSDFSSDEEAENAVKSAGFNVGYGGFSLGGSKASGSNSSRVSIESTEFCQLSSADFRSRLEYFSSTTDATTAVEAWSRCIAELGGDSVFLKYKFSGDGNGIIGDLVWSKSNGLRRISSIDISNDGNTQLECRVDGQLLTAGKVDVVIETRETGFSCRRQGGGYASFQVQTSSGSTGYIEILSQEQIEKREWDRIDAQISEIKADLSNFATQDKVDARFSEIQSEVSRLLPMRTMTKVIYTDVGPSEAPNPPGVRRDGRFYALDLMPQGDGVCFLSFDGDVNRPNIGMQKFVAVEGSMWVLKATRDADTGFGFVGATCIQTAKI